jgi:hypothetical protein
MDDIKDFKEYIESINEGLIKTYDIDKAIEYINNQMDHFNLNYKTKKNLNNTFEITFHEFNKIDSSVFEYVLEYITITLIDLLGWFPSKMEMVNFYQRKNVKEFNTQELVKYKSNIHTLTITLESKFDIVNKNKFDKLYHLTINEYKKRIDKQGIIPKFKSKLSMHDYDSRIYVCDNLDSCKKLVPKMKFFYNTEKNNILKDFRQNKNIEYIIYEIDVPCTNILNLYQDPNYDKGYYVLENISKDCIKIIDEE